MRTFIIIILSFLALNIFAQENRIFNTNTAKLYSHIIKEFIDIDEHDGKLYLNKIDKGTYEFIFYWNDHTYKYIFFYNSTDIRDGKITKIYNTKNNEASLYISSTYKACVLTLNEERFSILFLITNSYLTTNARGL